MKQPRAFPSLPPSEAKRLAYHQSRIRRYGIELTEVIESLPPTDDLLERQEARQYVQTETDED